MGEEGRLRHAFLAVFGRGSVHVHGCHSISDLCILTWASCEWYGSCRGPLENDGEVCCVNEFQGRKVGVAGDLILEGRGEGRRVFMLR